MNKQNRQIAFALFLSLCCYVFIGYFLKRENFLALSSAYLVAFTSYLFIIRQSDEGVFRRLLAAAVLLRLSFLFSFPALSDDFYRFVWDGRLFIHGINPFAFTPDGYIMQSSLKNPLEALNEGQVFQLMNSPEYFSVYPPACQFVFGFAALVSPHNLLGNIIILRLFAIAAEIGTIVLSAKLLSFFKLPQKNVWWYAFNPLVIIELSGNLHFEFLMIFFLILAIFLIVKSRNTFLWSAVAFACSAAVKLVPLMFLPFFIKRLGWKKSSLYFLLAAVTFLVLWLPFINPQLIDNFGNSIDLYFRKFEFNASIYYLIRWIGFQVRGYNIINESGPVLAVIVFFSVITMAVAEKKLADKHLFLMMQWSLTIFLLFSTTVHPWYITTLVFLSVFTEYRFAIVWSLVIVLSYKMYQSEPYSESLWLTALEYLLVAATLVFEWRKRSGQGERVPV